MVGIVTKEQALIIAQAAGLDLVEISPQVEPPICKILDFGKYKYENKKKSQEAKKKQKNIVIKEIKLRPNIAKGDLEIKMRNIRHFIDDGNKVKVSLQFRGRELLHQNLGYQLLETIIENLKDVIKLEISPKIEGNQITMIVIPQKQILPR